MNHTNLRDNGSDNALPLLTGENALTSRKLLGLRPYGLAVVLVGLATVLTMLLIQITDHAVFALFYAAVTVSAWRGGFRAGLVAIILSALSSAFFFMPSVFSLTTGLEELILIATFVLVATLISSLIKARARAETALAEREKQLSLILDATPALISYIGSDLHYRFNNPAYETWFGPAARDIAGRHVREVLGQAAYEALRPQLEAVLAGQPVSFEQIIPYHKGGSRYIQAAYTPDFDEQGQIRGFTVLVNDLSERKRTELGERLLAEAGKALASSLDYTVRLSKVAHLAVPDLADWCAVDLFNEDWSVQHVAVAHIDPAKVELAYELRQRYPAQQEELAKKAQPWQHGQAELYPEITEAMLEAGARDGEHYQILRELNLRSAMIVPLVVRDRVLGVMLFVWAESNRRYDEQDLALAEELARRAAIALDNARVYDAEKQARREAEEAAVRVTSLQAVTAALSGALTPAQASEIIIQYSTSVLEADGGTVMLISQDGTSLEMIQAIGYSEEALNSFQRFPLTAVTPAGDAVRTGEPIWLTSQHEFKARYPHLAPIRPAASLTEGVAVLPLLVESRPLGAVALSFNEVREFTAEDQDFLLTLASQCAQALERARLYQAEREARAEAETAHQSIVLLAEARERNRLAQELHDNVAQALGYLNLKVSLTHDLMASNQLGQAQANLQELKQIVGEAYTDIRGEIFNLRTNPSAGINFLDTLRQYIDKYKRFYQLEIELVFEADESFFEFPAEVAVSLIRTLQEALINVRKHAQVNEAVIRLQHERGQARLTVEDKGRGFEFTGADGSSFGLKIMHERMATIGGRLEVESIPGQGTRVTLLYPGDE